MQVFHVQHILPENRGGHILSGISGRLLQFRDDVLQRNHANPQLFCQLLPIRNLMKKVAAFCLRLSLRDGSVSTFAVSLNRPGSCGSCGTPGRFRKHLPSAVCLNLQKCCSKGCSHRGIRMPNDIASRLFSPSAACLLRSLFSRKITGYSRRCAQLLLCALLLLHRADIFHRNTDLFHQLLCRLVGLRMHARII